MRNKDVEKLPLKLQFFAEPTPEPVSDPMPEPVLDPSPEPKNFDDILKNKEYQAEFDRRVQKSIDTALANAQDKWKALTDDKLSEADKLAKMTKEEKADYLYKKREKELADKETALTRRELMAEAKSTLIEKRLPVGLVEILNYVDADSCNASIAAVEKAFHTAVGEGIQEKLKGGTPPKKAPENNVVTKEEYSKMGYTERLKLKTENPELYRQLTGN